MMGWWKKLVKTGVDETTKEATKEVTQEDIRRNALDAEKEAATRAGKCLYQQDGRESQAIYSNTGCQEECGAEHREVAKGAVQHDKQEHRNH